MAAVVFAGHLLPGYLKILLPLGPALNLDQDIVAHELDDHFGQAAFMVLDGRAAYPELPGNPSSTVGYLLSRWASVENLM